MTLIDSLADYGYFQGYAYAYPHKTAYRHLIPPVALQEAWSAEDKTSLFLYVHLPFCEMRCGFCNLFTTTHPAQSRLAQYLQSLGRQSSVVADALGHDTKVARLAIGGGTPTFLAPDELDKLFRQIASCFPSTETSIPKAIECSPGTVDHDRLSILQAHGVTRVSLGVQSFFDQEVRALGRLQSATQVRKALCSLATAAFPCLNIDLIYGIPGQNTQSWLGSLQQALEFKPQEIYLYPLYVRPLTGLERAGVDPGDERILFYRAGREFLFERGYRQISMRLFRAKSYFPPHGPIYCCQEDGMVGLGAGARSYTRSLHYSTEYAVGHAGVEAILNDYTQRQDWAFALADYGCRLDAAEQRRRYILKSLLRVDGLSLSDYSDQFGTNAFGDLPQLAELLDGGFANQTSTRIELNDSGFELSDVIGPWLCSAAMQHRMQQFALS